MTKQDINKPKEQVRHMSYWIDSIRHQEYSTLTTNLKTDVVIVGGGIAGLSIAYTLLKEGKSCIVIENGLIGGGETSQSSAHLTNALDARYYTLEQVYGVENTRLIGQSHTNAIKRIERIIKLENIDCDFKSLDGYLFLHPSDSIRSLQREFEATRQAGLSTELVGSAPDIRLKEKIALKFPHQAQFHPLKYVHGLCKAILTSEGKIFTNTKVTAIDEFGVNTEHYRIDAHHIVVATNIPFNDRFTMLASQHRHRSYLIAAKVHKGLITPSLWWDTGKQYSAKPVTPYHYARIQNLDEEFDLLICGGEDHVSNDHIDHAEESDRFINLEKWVYEHFPLARDVVYKWSGQIVQPEDLLGYIGRNPGDENIYVVTGDAGNGLTYGTIAGMLIPDLISNRKNPWEKIYSPSRLPAHIPEEDLLRKRSNRRINTKQQAARR